MFSFSPARRIVGAQFYGSRIESDFVNQRRSQPHRTWGFGLDLGTQHLLKLQNKGLRITDLWGLVRILVTTLNITGRVAKKLKANIRSIFSQRQNLIKMFILAILKLLGFHRCFCDSFSSKYLSNVR